MSIRKKKFKKKKQIKTFIPPVYVPTFLGYKLKKENWNQLWRLDTLENVTI